MYHLVVKNVGRSKTCYVNSAIAAAAYRSGSKLYDEETGKTWDYETKEVYLAEIISSNEQAFWAHDRQCLWTAVHHANPRKNACFAKEIELALPNKLDHATKIALTREFVRSQIVDKYGVIADIGYHKFEGEGSNNPHAHILFTIRTITSEGFGTRVSDLVQRKFVFDIRKHWSTHANKYLQKAGLPLIDERSSVRSGKPRRSVPMGYGAYSLEKKGTRTAPGEEHARAKQGLKTLRELEWERERARPRERI